MGMPGGMGGMSANLSNTSSATSTATSGTKDSMIGGQRGFINQVAFGRGSTVSNVPESINPLAESATSSISKIMVPLLILGIVFVTFWIVIRKTL